MWPKVFVKPSESVLELTSLGVLQLEGDGHGRGDDVAAAQGQEQQRQGGNLPTYFVNVHQLEINFVVKLWNDQNLYPTCNVSESVEAVLLIDVLQVLEDGHVGWHLLQLGRPCPCWGPPPPPSPPWTRPRPTSPASWWPTTCTSDESPQTHISSVESNICPRPTTDNVYYHRKSELMNEKYRLTFLYSLWASSNCLYSSANSAQSLMQTTCLSSISWPHNCDLLKLNQFTSEMSSLVLQFGLENINLTTIYW